MSEHASTTNLGTFITTGTRTTSPPDFTITIRRRGPASLGRRLSRVTVTGNDVCFEIQRDLLTAKGAGVLGTAFAKTLRCYLSNDLRLVKGGRAGEAS